MHDKVVCDWNLPLDTTLRELVSEVRDVEPENEEWNEMVETENVMIWLWLQEGSEKDWKCVSSDDDLQGVLRAARKQGRDRLYGRAWRSDDEGSPQPG